MDEKRLKVRCPIHRIFLTQEIIYNINVWFCQECNQYYTDRDFSINSGTALINNKYVEKFPDNIVAAIQKRVNDISKAKDIKPWINPNYKQANPKPKNNSSKSKVKTVTPKPQRKSKKLQMEHNKPEFTLPQRIKIIPRSSIIKVKLYRQDNIAVGECVIVEDVIDQDTWAGIFWVERELSSEIMTAVLSEKNRILYHGSQFKIASDIEKYKPFSSYANMLQQFCDKNNPKTVYIFNQKNLQQYASGKYMIVTAMVLCEKSLKPVPISVYYSEEQDRYFMNAESYQIYKERYGLPYIKLKAAEATFCEAGYSLREHSELNLYGYVVGEKDGLTDHERKSLLSNLLNSGLMKKHMIINHLEWLIHTRGGVPNMKSACDDWKSDLLFCLDYKIDEQKAVWATSLCTAK